MTPINIFNPGKIRYEETLIKLRKPKKCKDNYFELKKGFIWINDGINNKMIDPATFSEYSGWEQNILLSEETYQKRKDDQKDRVIVNNGIDQKQIKKEFLQEYLDNGWVNKKLKGVKKGDAGIPHSEETKKKLSEHFKGSKWMNDGIISKQIKPLDIQKYLNLDWTFGRLKTKKRI